MRPLGPPSVRRVVSALALVVATSCCSTEASEGFAPTTATVPPMVTTAATSTTGATTTTPSTTRASSTTSTTSSTTSTTSSTTTTTTTPATSTSTTTASTPPPVEVPLRIWVIGDSLAGPVGWGIDALGRAAGSAETIIENHGGSGLVRDDFFDWPGDTPRLLEETAPDIVVVILGANDGQAILEEDRELPFGSAEWLEAYRMRVEAFAAQLETGASGIYWVGVPIMEAAGYRARMEVLNALLADVAGDRDEMEYIDVWGLLAGPEGEYRSHLQTADGEQIAIRAPDGIHYTQAGADLVAARVFAIVADDWGLAP